MTGMQAQAEAVRVDAKFLLVAMDDDHDAHLTYCADEAAVEVALRGCLYSPRDDLDPDELNMVKINAELLIENGFLHFEGDPSIYLYRVAAAPTRGR
ncbi:hypothetical protein [Paraburkholderia xenovorans]|uniref:hypothetical protein n=1 Tax=Paraburkholderia xenovorans TaxID=36873 RepID=UPI0038BBE4E2